MALLSTVLSALVRKGILVGGILLVLLVFLEGVLWMFAPSPPAVVYHYSFDNDLESRGLSREAEFSIDNRQIRTRPGIGGRARECRTLVLGGSFVYEVLQSVEETWWGQLATQLENDHSEVAFPVFVKPSAAGVSQQLGIAIRNGVAWARTYLNELKPDLVIVVYGVSEVLDVESTYTFQQPSATAQPLDRGGWKDRLTDVSQLVRRLRHARQLSSDSYRERKALLETKNHFVMNDERQRNIYQSMPFDGRPPKRAKSANDPLREYLESLKTLKVLTEAVGAQLVVLGEPSLHEAFLSSTEEEESRLKRPRWDRFPSKDDVLGRGFRPDPAWVEEELTRYYHEASAWCQQAGVPFLNLNSAEVLPKTVEQFFSDTTLTNAGSMRVVEQITPVVAPVVEKILAN